MLFYILLFVISGLFCLYYILKESNYWKKQNIKEVNRTLWQFLFGNKSAPEIFKKIYDENDAHVGIHLGLQPFLLIKDLEDVNAVLAGEFQSFYKRGIMKKINPNDTLSNNVLFLDDYQKWKLIRQKLSPLFTSAKLRNMFYIMDKSARDFVTLLDEKPELRSRTYDAVSLYMTASIASAVFGVDTKLKNTMDSPFVDMARKSIQPSLRLNLLFTVANFAPWIMTAFNLKFFGDHEKFFVGFVKEVLESRRNENEAYKKHDFIDLCIELQKQGVMHDPATNYSLEPTDELMAAQAFFFFIAGIDTSSTTLQFVLLELSCNPKILAKVHDEIDGIYENGKTELTYNDIEKLHYLDMVMSEAMRKYPTIGVLQRQCTKSTVLPASKVQLVKGTGAVIPVFGLHRDPKYFPNPELFDPERFAPDNLSKIQHLSYLPFGEGNRICIGARFARLQMKTGLAWLLRNYTIEEQDYKPKYDKSPFSIRDTTSTVKLIKRNI